LHQHDEDLARITVEDISSIRKVLGKLNVDAGDVRRIAVLLRKILIEKELVAVAAPRIGRITLQAPDSGDAIASSVSKWIFYTANLPPIFRCPFDTMGSFGKGLIGQSGREDGQFILPEINSPPFSRLRSVNIDGFLTDPVAQCDGVTIRRIDIVKFVCYCGFGVHSGGKHERVYDRIEKFRSAFTMRQTDMGPQITVRDLGFRLPYGGKELDLSLLHLFSSAYYLCNSPDVLELERQISSS
jgi:hypothetical protein